MTPALPVAAAVLCLLASAAAQEPEEQPADPRAAAEAMLRSADEVMHQVEELRGYKFKAPVDKAVYTKAQLREHLAALMQKEYGGGKLERAEAWLRCLGLLPAGVDLGAKLTEVLLSQIGGFYDSERRSFFMMAEASVYGDTLGRMMIAHELCHALDDQYIDLRHLLKPKERELTEDESYVVGGVSEGSATALMSAWMQQAVKNGAKLADLGKMAEQQKDQMAVLLEAPPYCSLLAANYMVGLHFITKGKGMAGIGPGGDTGAAILEVGKAMPASSEQLLHPEKYWDPDKRDEPVVLVNAADLGSRVAAAMHGRVLERNTLGELVAALVAGPAQRKLNAALMARADYWTNKAARGWGGDCLLLVGKEAVTPGKAVVEPGVVWVTAWDTEQDRGEFVDAVTKYRGEQPGFAVAVAGRVAVFGFGSARRLGDAELAAVCDAAAFEQGGVAWRR